MAPPSVFGSHSVSLSSPARHFLSSGLGVCPPPQSQVVSGHCCQCQLLTVRSLDRRAREPGFDGFSLGLFSENLGYVELSWSSLSSWGAVMELEVAVHCDHDLFYNHYSFITPYPGDRSEHCRLPRVTTSQGHGQSAGV